MAFEKNDTYNKVVDIVSETLNIEKDSITPDSTFEKLGADSLDMLEIIMKLEEQFGIEISDEKAAEITTMQEAVEAIQEKRNK